MSLQRGASGEGHRKQGRGSVKRRVGQSPTPMKSGVHPGALC